MVLWAAIREPLRGRARPHVDTVSTQHTTETEGALAVRPTRGAG